MFGKIEGPGYGDNRVSGKIKGPGNEYNAVLHSLMRTDLWITKMVLEYVSHHVKKLRKLHRVGSVLVVLKY